MKCVILDQNINSNSMDKEYMLNRGTRKRYELLKWDLPDFLRWKRFFGGSEKKEERY